MTQRPFFRWAKRVRDVVEIVQQALNRILQEHDGKTIAIICHGGIIQAAFVYFFGPSAGAIPGVSIENASITQWGKLENTQRVGLETL